MTVYEKSLTLKRTNLAVFTVHAKRIQIESSTIFSPQRLPKDACRMPARLSTARLETRPWAICPHGPEALLRMGTGQITRHVTAFGTGMMFMSDSSVSDRMGIFCSLRFPQVFCESHFHIV